MGKGDKKTKRGKIVNGSYGRLRKRKKEKTRYVKPAVAQAPKEEKAEVAEETSPVKKAPAKKSTTKKTTAKKTTKTAEKAEKKPAAKKTTAKKTTAKKTTEKAEGPEKKPDTKKTE